MGEGAKNEGKLPPVEGDSWDEKTVFRRAHACSRAFHRIAIAGREMDEVLAEFCDVIERELGLSNVGIIFADGEGRALAGRGFAALSEEERNAFDERTPRCLTCECSREEGLCARWPSERCDECTLNILCGGKCRRVWRYCEGDVPVGAFGVGFDSGPFDSLDAFGVLEDVAQDVGVAVLRALKFRRAQLAERQRSHLLAAIEQAPDAVVLTDATGDILYVNPAFEKSSGYSLDEVRGRNPRVLKSGVHGREFYEEMWKTISSGKTWQGRIVNRRSDGAHYVEDTTISLVTSPEGDLIGYAAVKRDVTAQLQIEDRLRHSQKLEAIRTLASGAAHEINNPLSTIHGYGELIGMDQTVSDGVRKYAEEILRSSERIAGIVRSLSDFARPDTGGCQKLRVVELLEKSVGILSARLTKRGIEMTQNVSEDAATVYANLGRAQQIMVNLLNNACDALADMPSERRLTIASSRDVQRPELVAISVWNNGPTIPEEDRERIFLPFFTTKAPHGGTGLGLAVSRRMAEDMGGALELRTPDEGGADFVLKLPAPSTASDAQGAPE